MPYEPRLHVVLFQPEIPQNTGNIGRTCVAVGAKLWLIRPLGFRMDESRLRRAGMDYWDHLLWETVTDWGALVERLDQRRFWFFSKTGTQSIFSVPFQNEDVLVFGSESNGLPPSLLLTNANRVVRISMRSEVRSLNLACSVAVGCYEAIRKIEQ